MSSPPESADVPAIGHEHTDITGGWLRPAVFGAMDGLVSNFSLIAGVYAAGVSSKSIVITGVAGLFAGAFSMAAGEWISVTSQGESASAELDKERRELRINPDGEAEELAQMYIDRGVDPDLARELVRQLHRDPDTALEVHALEEMGINPDDLPSPWIAAGSSFLAFAIGAFIPLLPFLLGAHNLVVCSVLAAAALFAAGALTSRFTNRKWWFSGARQLVIGVLAALVTYGLGSLLHVTTG